MCEVPCTRRSLYAGFQVKKVSHLGIDLLNVQQRAEDSAFLELIHLAFSIPEYYDQHNEPPSIYIYRKVETRESTAGKM